MARHAVRRPAFILAWVLLAAAPLFAVRFSVQLYKTDFSCGERVALMVKVLNDNGTVASNYTGWIKLRSTDPTLRIRGKDNDSGEIDLTWCGIDIALKHGNRGLPGGSSLPQLLAKHRGIRNRSCLPRFTVKGILKWADAYHCRTGKWPKFASGPVRESQGDTWRDIDRALRRGLRGMKGGSSLAQLLLIHRGARHHLSMPRLTIRQILSWADAHHRRMGCWPTRNSGPIPEAPGETWFGVANALYKGYRGLRHTCLAQLLHCRCGARYRLDLPPLSIKQILAWADTHFALTGLWPTHVSGPVSHAPGENWAAIQSALQHGLRDLPAGSSLYQVLRKYRGVNRSVRAACRARLAGRSSHRWAR